MNKQRLAILIAAGVGALATFMPWMNVPVVGSINGTQGGGFGWITFILFAIPVVLCLLKDKTKPLEGVFLYSSIAAAIIAAGIGIWRIVEFESAMASISDPNNPFAEALTSSMSIGFGLYLLAVAGIAVAVLAFVVKDKKEVVSE